jgi:hypothetical protein
VLRALRCPCGNEEVFGASPFDTLAAYCFRCGHTVVDEPVY